MSRPSPEELARLSALLDELLELPAADRHAELERRLAGSAALLPPARRMLEEAAAAEAEGGAAGWAADAPGLLGQLAHGLEDGAHSGRELGPWRLLEPLGRGGMGEVYLAERADGQFEKQVAVKLLDRTIDSEAAREVFRHERQVLARLEHPYIARVLDGGVAGDGLPWFVMELVEGRPVDEWCRSRGASTADRVGVVLRACEAVAAAHRAGVVHRDLKPGNILVGDDGMPRLLDFGIAGGRGAGGAPGLSYTPGYAAPEQVAGDSVGPAADVYSLAVVLHELLAGERPGVGLSRAIPPGLARVLERGLEEDPGRRPADADALATELRGWLRSRPTRRPRAVAAVGLLVALAAGLWLGRGALAPGPAAVGPGPPRVGVEPFGEGLPGRPLATATRMELERIPGLVALGGSTGGSHVLAGAMHEVGPDLSMTAWLVDTARGDTLWVEGYELPARFLPELPGRIADRVAEGLGIELAPALRQRLAQPPTRSPGAYAAYLRGLEQLELGQPGLAQAALREAISGDPSFAVAIAAAGRLQMEYLDGRARPLVLAGLPVGGLERAVALDPDQPGARVDLARSRMRAGELEPALDVLRETLSRWPHHPGSLWELGELWRRVGELDHALGLGGSALALDPQLAARPFLALLHAGREAEFLAHLQGDAGGAPLWRAVAQLRQRDEVAALASLRAAPDPPAWYPEPRAALLASLTGDLEAGRAALRGYPPPGGAPGSTPADEHYLRAVAWARLGEPGEAAAELALAVEAGFPCAPCFERDPLLAPLRGAGVLEPVLEEARIRARALHGQSR